MRIIKDRIANPRATVESWVYTNTVDCTSVVELGAGFFNMLKVVNPTVSSKIGIEIWQPYIDNSKCPECIKVQGDVFEYETLVDKSLFDCVMIIDVLEHFEKEKSKVLIERLKEDFRKILLMIPEGYHPQEGDVTGYGAHEYQKHRSTWGAKEIEEDLGFDDVLLYENFHNQEGKDSGCVFAIWHKK